MKGVTLAILIAFIVFVIAIVSLGLEFFQILEVKPTNLNTNDFLQINSFLNY